MSFSYLRPIGVVQPLGRRYASAGRLLRVKPVLVSAGDKCAATEFAKSGTKSSNLQTNKCAVGVRGQPINDWLFAVSPSLWNSDLISDCLPSTVEFSTDSEGTS